MRCELLLATPDELCNLPIVNTLELQPSGKSPWWYWSAIVIFPVLLVAFSAKPFAGGWNDGSRLAAIDAIINHGTLYVDQSIFVSVPVEMIENGRPPYDLNQPLLLQYGTLDKLCIDGHFYSDKPMIVAIIYAGIYRVWELLSGERFLDNISNTIRVLTLLSSGFWYCIAVWSWVYIAHSRGWPFQVRMLMLVGFAFGSIAVPYAQAINAHEIYLGVFSAMLVCIERLRHQQQQPLLPLLALATLGGFAYNLDPGLAPGLVLATTGYVIYRLRSVPHTLSFITAALPWVLAYHGLNYYLGGPLLKPLNSVPDFFNYPGSPFDANNITGFWQHASVQKFLLYMPDLLIGKQGFLTHNLPMVSVIFAVPILWRSRQLTAEHVVCLAFMTLGFFSYAVLSKNHGGACCSIRWFVPFLACGYIIVGDYLANVPARRIEQAILTIGGLLLAVMMAIAGPWTLRLIPGYWPIMATTLLLTMACFCYRQWARTATIMA